MDEQEKNKLINELIDLKIQINRTLHEAKSLKHVHKLRKHAFMEACGKNGLKTENAAGNPPFSGELTETVETLVAAIRKESDELFSAYKRMAEIKFLLKDHVKPFQGAVLNGITAENLPFGLLSKED